MKEKLNELVQALIEGDSKKAEKALHDYLTDKTRAIINELRDPGLDDDEVDFNVDVRGDDDVDDLGDEDDLDVVNGDEGLEDEDIEDRVEDLEDRVEDLETHEAGEDDELEGDEDLDVNRDKDLDVRGLGGEDDELSGLDMEEQEELLRKGRRTDKASRGRTRR